MNCYRLTREKYAAALSGKGAAINGGRWNSAGVELIYCAANRSLAMAEVAVHFSFATLPDDYIMLTIEIPSKVKVGEISISDLPKNWNRFPNIKSTSLIGDQFVQENKYAVCKVPSVVTQGDFNILINPKHSLFSKIKISERVPFYFDRRLFK